MSRTPISKAHRHARGCGCLTSRRGLFMGAGSALALAGLPATVWGQAVSGRIDVHHHFDPNRVIPASMPPGSLPMGPWSVDKDLEDMDRGGVRTAMLSWFAPVDGTPDIRRRAARAINEAGAKLAADHPNRFALLANLPLPDIDAALAELAYGMDTLNAHGVCLSTNDGARWLGESHYDPLFAELNRRKAVVFVHPFSAACCHNLVIGVPDTLIEFGADTTRCIASLIFNGMTTRFPDVRFIFSHAGGATMAVIERFVGGAHGDIVPGIDTKGVAYFQPKQPPLGALHEIRKMHFDTAQATNGAILNALKTVVSASQILYGTDAPFQTAEITSKQVRASGAFDAAELDAVEHGNALRLFPRLLA